MKYEHNTAIIIKDRTTQKIKKVLFVYKAEIGAPKGEVIIQYYESRINDNGIEYLLPFKHHYLSADDYALIMEKEQYIREELERNNSDDKQN